MSTTGTLQPGTEGQARGGSRQTGTGRPEADRTVDARGASCQGPMLAAKLGVAVSRVGQIVAILTMDKGTQRDLPIWAEKMGHEYMGMTEERDGCKKLFVRRVH